MTDREQLVVGGVDTHKDVHVAAVIDGIGRIVATSSFPTTRLGERALCRWMRSWGRLERVGVEGTGTYGAGLCRYLESEGVTVVEVNRPNRQMRRRRGKSDTVDAEAAARAVLNGEATVVPRDRTGVVESIRMVRVAFCSAREARTKVANQIRDLVLTAPDDLRAQLGGLTTAERVKRCARLIPGDGLDATNGAKVALRHLARRYQSLTEEADELHARLDRLTADANPALRSAKGVGVDVASILLVAAGENPERLKNDAAFSAMCGVSPVPVLWEDPASPPEPQREPPGEPRLLASRDGAPRARRPEAGLRRAPDEGGTLEARGAALSEALHRERDLCAARPTGSGRSRSRAPGRAGHERQDPRERSERPRHLAHRALPP